MSADDRPSIPRQRQRQRQQEDPHDGPLHHDYALGRDLPTIPHQRDEEES